MKILKIPEVVIFYAEKVPKNWFSISKDAKNAEYRFLRIIIQEHAPKIVKYRNELEADSRLILDNYKNLPQFLQQVITDYSKKSKVLKQ